MYTPGELLDIANRCTPTPYNTAFNKYVVVNGALYGQYYYIHIVVLGNKSNHLYEVMLNATGKTVVNCITSYSLADDEVRFVGELTEVSQLTDYELRKLIYALVETYEVNGFDLSYCGGGLRNVEQTGVPDQIIVPFFLIVARIFGTTSNPNESFYPQVFFTVPDKDNHFAYVEWTLANDGTHLPQRRIEMFSSIDEFKASRYYLSDEMKYPRFVLDQQQVCLDIVEENTTKKGGEV